AWANDALALTFLTSPALPRNGLRRPASNGWMPLRGVRASTIAMRSGMIPMPWSDNTPATIEDPLVDDTEEALVGTNLLMTSSVFGFPDFGHLVELQDQGVLRWYGGLTSKEPGNWCLVRGNPKEGEREEDLFLELIHKLTDLYKEAFSVSSGICYWRGKLELKETKGGDIQEVRIEGGIVVSAKENSDEKVREGVLLCKHA
ncbi:unnamed protein product, partial [Prorocentrum cordatum]